MSGFWIFVIIAALLCCKAGREILNSVLGILLGLFLASGLVVLILGVSS